MGNLIACGISGSKGKKQYSNSRCVIKVIFPNGEIRQFNPQNQVKAAEIMFETPGFFLTNVNSIHMGRRFSALNADEDLEMANVYIMYPMNRVNSLITAADMAALFLIAKKSSSLESSKCNHNRLPNPPIITEEEEEEVEVVTPATETLPPPPSLLVPKLKLDDIEEFSTPEFKHRLTMCRSKKPLLETIIEEPYYTR